MRLYLGTLDKHLVEIFEKILLFSFLVILINSCEQPNLPLSTTEIYSLSLDGSRQINITTGDHGGLYLFAGDKIIYDFISSVNIDGTNPHKIVPTYIFSENNIPTDFAISADRGKIVFTSIIGTSEPNLYLMNSDGSNFYKLNLPDTTSNKFSPQFSYDGKEIVFYTPDGIYECNLFGEEYKKILDDPTQKSIKYIDPHFAPGDNGIVYIEYNDSTFSFLSIHLLYTITIHDTTIFTFTNSSPDYYEISQDNSILFVMSGNIHVISLNDFTDKIVAFGTDAHFSPDFSYISYIDPNSTSFDLLNLKTGIKDNIKLTDKFESIGEPRLSPSGTEIIFIGVKNKN